jgi:integrin alpha FG-GAP repeat containing protein 1
LIYDTTHQHPLPLPIKIGDTDLDGFPDLLFIVVTKDDKRVPKLAWNVRCGLGEPGCPAIQSQSTIKRFKEDTKKLFMSNLIWRDDDDAAVEETKIGGRGFVVAGSGGDASVLSTFNDARSVSFLDIDEDGTLDIMVQRTGSGVEGKGKLGNGSRVNFIKNNVWRDAFFLKAIGGSPFDLFVV